MKYLLTHGEFIKCISNEEFQHQLIIDALRSRTKMQVSLELFATIWSLSKFINNWENISDIFCAILDNKNKLKKIGYIYIIIKIIGITQIS